MTTVQSQTHAPTPPAWQPDPNHQGAYTAHDVDQLPDYAPRVQLADGVITAVPSPTLGHQTIAALLWGWLRNNAPPGVYEAGLAVGVLIDDRNTIEPDVLLLHGLAARDRDRHYFLAREVVLAVEVVSPSTTHRDRVTKLNRCAAAGIPHYWLVEQPPLRVCAYALDGDGTYTLIAEAAELLELASPFPITLRVENLRP